MKIVVLFTLCCALSAQAHPQGTGKIIGGQEARLGQFPFIVSLQDSRLRSHFCGGALISTTVVISAGHCFYGADNPADTVVYVGSNDLGRSGTYVNVKRIVVHENFNAQGRTENDITLLELSQPVTLGPNVATIKLPTANEVVPDGTPVVALGWGTTRYPNQNYPDILNYVPINVVGNAKCQSAWGSNQILDTQVCVGGVTGKGLCFGDSGSPLVRNNDTTIGIVSYGQPCGIGTPDVFTAVASFVPWIQRTSAAFEALNQQ